MSWNMAGRQCQERTTAFVPTSNAVLLNMEPVIVDVQRATLLRILKKEFSATAENKQQPV